MHNNLTASVIESAAIKIIKNRKTLFLLNQKMLKEFEQTWSKWLGV